MAELLHEVDYIDSDARFVRGSNIGRLSKCHVAHEGSLALAVILVLDPTMTRAHLTSHRRGSFGAQSAAEKCSKTHSSATASGAG